MRTLRRIVGITALLAPLLHSITDAMEWYHGGYTALQLWLNYVAFVPMSWLLLGLYAVHDAKPNVIGLVGAILYGAAFTYFAHTTLYALDQQTPNYEFLWQHLGTLYTVHGGLMVCGGILFAGAALKVRWLPPIALWVFLAGIATNLVLSILPAPDILQTIGSTVRNAGLMGMGYFVLHSSVRRDRVCGPS